MSNHAWTVWVGRIAVLRKLDLEQRVGVAELGRLVIGQTGNRLGILAGPRRRIRPWHRADHFALSGGMMLGNSSRGPDLPFKIHGLGQTTQAKHQLLKGKSGPRLELPSIIPPDKAK